MIALDTVSENGSVLANTVPRNRELEQAVLGTLMFEEGVIARAVDQIRESDFYWEHHKRIWLTIKRLYEDKQAVDVVTIGNALELSAQLDFCNGRAYLTDCVVIMADKSFPSALESHIKTLRELSVARQIQDLAFEMKNLSQAIGEQSSLEVLGKIESSLSKISLGVTTTREEGILADIAQGSYDRIVAARETGALGFKSGFADLDSCTRGFRWGSMVEIAGRPGSGKCLSGSTRILDTRTGQMVPIRELVDPKNVTVASLAPNWKLLETSPLLFHRNGLQDVFRIKTMLGREIVATANHEFLTITGWLHLSDLKPGQRIACPREMPFFGNLDVPEHQIKALAYFLGDGSLISTSPLFTNCNSIILADFKAAIALFDGAETVVAKTVVAKQGRDIITYRVRKDPERRMLRRKQFGVALEEAMGRHKLSATALAKSVGVCVTTVCNWRDGASSPPSQLAQRLLEELGSNVSGDEDIVALQVGEKNSVSEWLNGLGLLGKDAHGKFIPQLVFKLTKTKLSLFLNRLFSCDGSVYVSKTGAGVTYTSVSQKMACDVQHLLLRFGILSGLRKRIVRCLDRYHTTYQLDITGTENVGRFLKYIGLYGQDGRVAKAEEAINTITNKHSNVDVIPIAIWAKVSKARGHRTWAEIQRLLGFSDEHNLHVWRRQMSRQSRVLNDLELQQIARSEVYWDKIRTIERAGVEETYDLSIDRTHNFVAGDIIVHNSSIAMEMAWRQAKSGIPVGFLTLEMNAEDMVDRLLQSIGGLTADELISPNGRSKTAVDRALSATVGVPLHIARCQSTTAEVCNAMRRLRFKQGCKIFYIDHFQCIRDPGYDNDQRMYSNSLRRIRDVVDELELDGEKPGLVLLVQLNRETERTRSDPQPKLHQLRDTGRLEIDGDMVLGLYRPAIYGKCDESEHSLLEVHVLKNRFGPVGRIVKLCFFSETQRFADWTQDRFHDTINEPEFSNREEG